MTDEAYPTVEQYDRLAARAAAYESVLRMIAPPHGHANPRKSCEEIGETYERWAREVLEKHAAAHAD